MSAVVNDVPDPAARPDVDAPNVHLSVIMPAHNEAGTIGASIREVLGLEASFKIELIVVDDGSTDETPMIIESFGDDRLITIRHSINLGKGAAVKSGAATAVGTHMVVFDADREYAAIDLVRMFEPVLLGRTAVVFGTRMFGMNTVYRSFRYAMGNKFTTLVANILYDACLTDLHTCLKMMPVALFRELDLYETGFGLDSEITAELLRRGYRPFEVPVSYMSRSHAQGKKLTWRDGVRCLVVLGKVRLRGKRPAPVALMDARTRSFLDDVTPGPDTAITTSSLRTSQMRERRLPELIDRAPARALAAVRTIRVTHQPPSPGAAPVPADSLRFVDEVEQERRPLDPEAEEVAGARRSRLRGALPGVLGPRRLNET
jgi:dolichol-phosphate hexosyltransferase